MAYIAAVQEGAPGCVPSEDGAAVCGGYSVLSRRARVRESPLSASSHHSSTEPGGQTRTLAAAVTATLGTYANARRTERIGKSSPTWQQLMAVGPLLRNTAVLRAHPRVAVKVSAGQGAWARIPWIAFLHGNVTTTTREGVYVIFLFREDMSGVYLTLNQGVTEPIKRLGKDAGILAVRERATRIRDKVRDLEDIGFELDAPLDLRSDYVLAQRYTVSTIAHKLYERGAVPEDDVLLGDVARLLCVYERLA